MRFLVFLLMLTLTLPAPAVKLSVGPDALQRAIVRQLFKSNDGRRYIRGKPDSHGCYVDVDSPQLQFIGDRIFLSLHIAGKMGGSLPGLCLGIGWAGGAEISMLPHAEGSVIGFDDVRVERLSGDHTFDRLLGPLLATAAPHQFKVDARALINKMLLATSARSGTSIALDRFTITGMQIQGQALLLDIDGTVTIQ